MSEKRPPTGRGRSRPSSTPGHGASVQRTEGRGGGRGEGGRGGVRGEGRGEGRGESISDGRGVQVGRCTTGESAWSRRPGPPPETFEAGPTVPSIGRSTRAPTPNVAPATGRGHNYPTGTGETRAAHVPETIASGPSAGGEAATNILAGRGAIRGRRVINSDSLVVTRPADQVSKQGNSGTPITIQANYFIVKSSPTWGLYQYHVDFNPEEDRTAVRKALLRLHQEQLGVYLFDGTTMFTVTRYANCDNNRPLEFFVNREPNNEQIRISIRLICEMKKTDPQYLQFFNIIMRKGLQSLQLQLVGRNHFDPVAKISVPEYKFEIWPGIESSIRQHEKHLLMSVEITHKIMRQETVLDILRSIKTNCRDGDWQSACKGQIIGSTVLTRYNTKTYRVDDIQFDMNPESTFKIKERGEEREISYIDYYQRRYDYAIRDVRQPLLLSRPTARDRRSGTENLIYLVPEFCRATGITDSMRNDFRLMKAMSDHTRIGPARRIERLLTFNQRLLQNPEVMTEFQQWNLALDNDIINLPARVLPLEGIIYNGSTYKLNDKPDWNGSFRNTKMVVCVPLKDWILIVPKRVDQKTARIFVDNLKKAGAGLGFAIADPTLKPINDDRPGTYASTLEETLSQRNPQLILCIALSQRADIYSTIKKKCCVDRPVPSQVVLQKNLNNPKGAMSVATKIAIQLNCKIGGAPWVVDIPRKGMMIVGFDVCHDPNRKGTDYGAMVASLNQGCTKYYSAVSHHSKNQEISEDFAKHIVCAIKKYSETNDGILPSNIIIYRDGVGDGQIPYVYEHELKNIRHVLEKLYGNPELVKLTYIIVTKKLSTRLFYKRKENPPAGTVVDDVITNPNRYDFLLVAQHVGQGSVSPVAYNVIYDNSGLSPDRMQRLTYKLTYLYYNWSGTVKVPAPCQLAHKLAFLVAQAVQKVPNTHLETLLYYL